MILNILIIFNNMKNEKLKMADLCAGTGAFSLAFEKTNKIETIYANDFDKNSKKFFDENNKIKLSLKDINNVDVKKEIPKIDILTSGFPCQSFSIAGKQKGFDDYRSNVFWKIIEIMKYHKPKVVVLENVKNLKSHDKGKTFKKIIDEIEKINYYYKYKILNTCEITETPQNRERIYIVCFLDKDKCEKFNFPEKISNDKKLKLNEIIENNINPKYYYNNKSKIFDKLENNIQKNIKDNIIYQYRRYYVRENKNNLCPTLTANMGTGGHNVPIIKDNIGIRKLTPKECFKLQGFPSNYIIPDKMSDSSLYKLAGNAVSYNVVEKISKIIIKLFNN